MDKNEGLISSCLEVHDGNALEVTWGLLKQLMRLSIIYCYIMYWLSVYRSWFSSYNFLVGCVMAR